MLTVERVREIFVDCLFRNEEIENGQPKVSMIKVNGITVNVGFHKERVEQHSLEITELCNQLPVNFKKGMTFLEMCNNQDGEQWAEHKAMEELLMLGLATNKMDYCVKQRELWSLMPGGMLYVIVK